MISSVPTNSGTAPNDPELATWSARIAVCGLHWVPNRNSLGATESKKRAVSNTSESTMPIVTRIASVEDKQQDAAQESLDVNARRERGPDAAQRDDAAREPEQHRERERARERALAQRDIALRRAAHDVVSRSPPRRSRATKFSTSFQNSSRCSGSSGTAAPGASASEGSRVGATASQSAVTASPGSALQSAPYHP